MRLLLTLLVGTGAEAVAEAGLASGRQPAAAASGAVAPYGGGAALQQTVFVRAREQLAAAKGAEAVSELSAKGLLVDQQHLVANMAQEEAQKESDKVVPKVPKAQAALREAKRLLREAELHADHAQRAVEEVKLLPRAAAEEATRAIEVRVWQEAAAAAQRAASAPPRSDEERAREANLRAAVTAAPHRRALRSAVDFVAHTYQRAHSAVAAAVALARRAHRLAFNAQGIQASGDEPEAEEAMFLARSTMAEAESLKVWARKLYRQAEKVHATLGRYQQAEQTAIASAKGVAEPVRVLPPLPP